MYIAMIIRTAGGADEITACFQLRREPNLATRKYVYAVLVHVAAISATYHGGKYHQLPRIRLTILNLEPQSRSGDKPVKFQVVLSPNGTSVLKGLNRARNKSGGTERRTER